MTMTKDNQSFFERLTGSAPEEDDREAVHAADDTPASNQEEAHEPQENGEEDAGSADENQHTPHTAGDNEEWLSDLHEEEGQLTVDVYQTPTHVVVQAPMAGVKSDDVDVSINNDMITIRGRREQKQESDGDDYYYRELFWGAFSRSILLPEEVDSNNTEASFKAGLLTVRMPKVKKDGTGHIKIQTKEI